MKNREKLHWLMNIRKGKLFFPSQSSFQPLLPSLAIEKSRGSFSKPSFDQNSFALNASSRNIVKPFTLHERSLFNAETRPPIPEKTNKKEGRKGLLTKSHQGKLPNDKKPRCDYVKAHSKGFGGDISDDFFKHYYRMLLSNLVHFLRKNEKSTYKNLELIEENLDKEKGSHYVPNDMKLFFLEKAKKDVDFYDKILSLYENQPRNRESNIVGSSSFEKKIEFQYNKTLRMPQNMPVASQKFFREDEFLRFFIKKVKKFGVQILTQEDVEAVRRILHLRKRIFDVINQKDSASILNEGEAGKEKAHKKHRIKSNFLQIIQSIIRSTGVLNEGSSELLMRSMNLAITRKNANQNYSLPLGSADEPYSSRLYRSLTTKNGRLDQEKLEQLDPEVSLRVRHRQRKKAMKIARFSTGTQKFLREVMRKRDAELEGILSKIKAKSEGLNMKKGSDSPGLKPKRSKTMTFDPVFPIGVIEEGEEIPKVESLVHEIEKITKITQEELLTKDIDSFLLRAQELERELKEQFTRIQQNRIQENSRPCSASRSRPQTISRNGDDESISSTTSRPRKSTKYSNGKKASKQFNKLRESINEIVDGIGRNKAVSFKKGQIHRISLKSPSKADYSEDFLSIRPDSGKRGGSLNYNEGSTQGKNPVSKPLMNGATKESIILDAESGNRGKKFDSSLDEGSDQNSLEDSRELKVARGPRSSSLPNIAMLQSQKFEEKKAVIIEGIGRRQKAKTVYTKEPERKPQIVASVKAEIIEQIKGLSVKETPIPSFKNALVLLPHLKRNIKKKLKEHKIFIDRSKIVSSIPPISPSGTLRGSTKKKTQRINPIKPSSPLFGKSPMNGIPIIYEPENKNEASPKEISQAITQKSQRNLLLSSKQPSRNLLSLKSIKSKISDQNDLDEELRDALNELEYENKRKEDLSSKKKKIKALIRESTMRNLDGIPIKSENSIGIANNESLMPESSLLLPPKVFNLQSSLLEMREQRKSAQEVNYWAELKKQKKDEIDIFIRNLEEGIEKNILGQFPCIDQLKLFIEELESERKDNKNQRQRAKDLVFFDKLPVSPKKLIKDNHKQDFLKEDEPAESSEEDENVRTLIEKFQRNTPNNLKDEQLRKKHFLMQRKILKMVEAFIEKSNSHVRQRGLSDNRKGIKAIKSSNPTEKSGESLLGLQKTVEEGLKGKKTISVEAKAEEKIKEEKEKVKEISKIKINNRGRFYDVFFANSKKKSKERLKVKIF